MAAWFQSQPRSRSISDLPNARDERNQCSSFNLNREAAPLATPEVLWGSRDRLSFNLNREAAPLATRLAYALRRSVLCFNLNREAAPLATGYRDRIPCRED